MEISFLMNSFLKSREENLDCRSYWVKKKRKWIGCTLYISCIYRSPSHQVAKIMKNELCNVNKLYAHMQI